MILELGIYISHIVWRIRYRELRRKARIIGKSIDELLDLEANGQGVVTGTEGSDGLEDIESGRHVKQSSLSAFDGDRSITSEKC